MDKKNYPSTFLHLSFSLILFLSSIVYATDYHVGPGHPLNAISEVPWATLEAGDRVFIHWRSIPYKEKWVINRQGTASNRIEIIGINGPQGEQPVIDGNGAVTATGLNYWNEPRGIIKIGGSNTPADGLPNYITIENLEIRSARPAYQFTNDTGQIETYTKNAAAVYVEKAENLIIRNCTLKDSGNGLFIGASDGQTQNILIENNYIYDNGIEGSIFEHNAYTAAIDITYQYNRFGPLRTGAGGNNLKDRSAGLTVRYNWIESGNRQLDLVDAEDSSILVNHPSYHKTFVYGNILIEPEGAGNSQIAHYGGDSGTTSDYRKGDLYFYNNTVISTRTGNITLLRLSTNDETAHVFNNILYTTSTGNRLAMVDGNGTLNLHHNWIKTDWKDCHCAPNGIINNLGAIVEGATPLFVDFNNQNFNLQSDSPAIDNGVTIPSVLIPDHTVLSQYVVHIDSESRNTSGTIDMGALEFNENLSLNDVDFESMVRLYPNPTKNEVIINSETLQLEHISLYNAMGQEVFDYITHRNIDLSNKANGLYIVKVTDKKGRKIFKKIVKE